MATPHFPRLRRGRWELQLPGEAGAFLRFAIVLETHYVIQAGKHLDSGDWSFPGKGGASGLGPSCQSVPSAGLR